MPEIDAGLLTWSDIAKLVAGFVSSLLLLWLGLFVQRRVQYQIVRRAVWNVVKHHTSAQQFFDALDATADAARQGGVYLVNFDLSSHLSELVSRLADLDPLNSDIYIEFLSKEHVVRAGLDRLTELKISLVNARKDAKDSWPSENVSIRNSTAGLAHVLKKDLYKMYEAELELLKHIQIRRKDSVDPIKNLEAHLEERRSVLNEEYEADENPSSDALKETDDA